MAWPTKTDFVDGDVLSASQMNNIGTNLNLFNPTSATNGQVWVANGSGSGAYGTPTTTTWNLIAQANLPAATAVNITSIPSTYRQLFVVFRNITCGTTSSPRLRFNNVSTNVYMNARIFGGSPGGPAVAGSTALSSDITIQGADNTGGTNLNGTLFVYLPHYSLSCYQTGQFAFAYNGSSQVQFSAGFFSFGTATTDYTITEINLVNWGGNLTGGTYELYGAT